MADAQSRKRRRDFKDLTGQKFGRWTVLEQSPSDSKKSHWLCRCECGVVQVCRGDILSGGGSRSCGCFNSDSKRTHGMSQSGTYFTWKSMIARCYNPKHGHFDRYGGRGITVCDEWKTFDGFLESMGVRPEGKTLDREHNDGNYEPGNCRWVTWDIQGGNKSTCIHITIDGVTRPFAEWCNHFGVAIGTARSRIYLLKWDVVRAVSTPPTIVRPQRKPALPQPSLDSAG